MEKIQKILQNKLFYIVIVLLTGIYALLAFSIDRKSQYEVTDTNFEGTLVKLVVSDEKVSFTIKSEENLICNLYTDEKGIDDYRKTYLLGMKLRISGSLNAPTNNTIPNTFNYKEYLYYHDTFYTCNIEKIEIIDEDDTLLYKIKNFIVSRIMTFDTADYLYTMIIGDKSLMDDDVLDKYKQNGVTHLFAISGMHIGLFSAAFLSILKKFRLKENKRYFITTIFIWLYAFLTGFTSSVLRASMLFTFLSINKVLKLNIKTIYVLVLTGVVLIFYNPFIIKDIGFVYSFITTFGLIYNSPLLKKHKIIGTSLVAMLYSLPISIDNFYSFNLLSILFNVIFVPFVSTIIYPLCLLTFIFRFLEPILKLGIFFLEILNDLSSKLDFLIFIVPKMNILLIVLYYTVLILFLKKRFWSVSVILFAIIFLNKARPILDSNYYVEFLDVGQGDSMLLRTPYKKEVILIDTGGKMNYGNEKRYYVSDNVITYLHSLGIDTIDTLILSHGDYDHMGDAINLVNNSKVEKVIFNNDEYNDLELELIEVLKDRKIPYYRNIKELDISNNKLYFLSGESYDDENDNSNVIYTNLDGIKMLLMGDAGVDVEEDILEKYNLKEIDILKVGHHGSKTSSSKKFIDEITPKHSVISVGKNNRYGHPNDAVLDNLAHSIIYRTDLEGSIIFKIKKDKLIVETCPP